MDKLPMDELEGFFPYPPGDEAAHIDNDVAAKSTCARCGHHGGIYSPWIKFRTGDHAYRAYRAFVICPACGNVEEF